MKVVQYSDSLRSIWDNFVSHSLNSTFLHFRNYLEYHSDRFIDHSLLIYSIDGKLLSVLPANRVENQLYSHQGLTYGGLLFTEKCPFEKIRGVLEVLFIYLKTNNFKTLIYKPIPIFYCERSNDIEQYMMWRYGAELDAMFLNSVVSQNNKFKFSKNRIEGVKKFKKLGGEVVKSDNFEEFWINLTKELVEKYKTKPVHSFEEIDLLQKRFSQNIELYIVQNESQKFCGGAVLYISKNVVHVQYISSTTEGRAIGALDFLFDKLINEIYLNIPFFDFGNSNEQGGRYLNRTLLFQKEGFGAETKMQYVWNLDIENSQIPGDLLS